VHDARAGQPATDRIKVAGITATGHHGVFDHERRDGQTFIADVVLHVDTRAAAAQDRLELTADYGVLAQQVVGVLEGEPADLIETVAERIAAVAMTHHGVVAVDVVVHKPQAPVTVPVGDVTVEIHRSIEHPPAVAGPPVVVGQPTRDAADAEEVPVPALEIEPMPSGATAFEAGRATTVHPLLEPTAAMPTPEHSSQTSAQEPKDRLDAAPGAPVDVVLALGSNVGSSHETLRQVVLDLADVEGLEVTAIAPLARTGAVGGPEQPDFLNTVVLGRTTLSARALLARCQRIEDDHGRVREERWGPRTIDIDLITYGSTVASADDLELPHPRAHERAFVLEPWAQVDPGAVLPGLGGGPVAALAGTAPDRGGIRWMALDWWGAPEAGPR
jgi:dihydroneopterin aldolase/2-amino-4-hydroxy-6-hydroxymethyldihydropteridine diphosphokinase